MLPSSNRSSRIFRSVLTGGATVAGAYTGLSIARWWYRQTLPPPSTLPSALKWETKSTETEHGRTFRYVRPGTGTPIVLLHTFSPAASTYDVKPIAEHLSSVTNRPIWAVDWLGFGKSDRPDIQYTSDVFGQQLYQLLSEGLGRPADLVAVGLGCEYAAWMSLQAAPLVRRLVLISPTGLTTRRDPYSARQLGLSVAGQSGLFELAFYRMTGPESLRTYYGIDVFLDKEKVPEDLIHYSHKCTQVRGAPHAPYSALRGHLHLKDAARELYSRLYRSTLLLTPATSRPTHRTFNLLTDVLDQNDRNLTHKPVAGGLLPQWETPAPCFEAVDRFLLQT